MAKSAEVFLIRTGYRIPSAPEGVNAAEVIVRLLNEVGCNEGTAPSREQVDNAIRIAMTPGHEANFLFPWDDKEAAHKWRQTRMRYYASAIEIKEKNVPKGRAYFPIPLKDHVASNKSYTSAKFVKSDEDAMEAVHLEYARNVVGAVKQMHQQGINKTYEFWGDLRGLLMAYDLWPDD